MEKKSLQRIIVVIVDSYGRIFNDGEKMFIYGVAIEKLGYCFRDALVKATMDQISPSRG
jgi:hypothetical protein